jgi:hypothetical protein
MRDASEADVAHGDRETNKVNGIGALSPEKIFPAERAVRYR